MSSSARELDPRPHHPGMLAAFKTSVNALNVLLTLPNCPVNFICSRRAFGIYAPTGIHPKLLSILRFRYPPRVPKPCDLLCSATVWARSNLPLKDQFVIGTRRLFPVSGFSLRSQRQVRNYKGMSSDGLVHNIPLTTECRASCDSVTSARRPASTSNVSHDREQGSGP